MMTKTEIKHIKKTYRQAGNRLKRAAAELRIDPATLRRILVQNGVEIRRRGRPRIEDAR